MTTQDLSWIHGQSQIFPLTVDGYGVDLMMASAVYFTIARYTTSSPVLQLTPGNGLTILAPTDLRVEVSAEQTFSLAPAPGIWTYAVWIVQDGKQIVGASGRIAVAGVVNFP